MLSKVEMQIMTYLSVGMQIVVYSEPSLRMRSIGLSSAKDAKQLLVKRTEGVLC